MLPRVGLSSAFGMTGATGGGAGCATGAGATRATGFGVLELQATMSDVIATDIRKLRIIMVTLLTDEQCFLQAGDLWPNCRSPPFCALKASVITNVGITGMRRNRRPAFPVLFLEQYALRSTMRIRSLSESWQKRNACCDARTVGLEGLQKAK